MCRGEKPTCVQLILSGVPKMNFITQVTYFWIQQNHRKPSFRDKDRRQSFTSDHPIRSYSPQAQIPQGSSNMMSSPLSARMCETVLYPTQVAHHLTSGFCLAVLLLVGGQKQNGTLGKQRQKPKSSFLKGTSRYQFSAQCLFFMINCYVF